METGCVKTLQQELCCTVVNVILCQLTIIDIIFASRVGQVWHECTIDITRSTVCDWSPSGISASIATRYNVCIAAAAHVYNAPSVDCLRHLRHAISQPSSCTFCVRHGDTDLPQPGITVTTLWAWTLLQKVRDVVSQLLLCNFFIYSLAMNCYIVRIWAIEA